MSFSVESELGFLARDITYETVKPYSLRFTPPDSSPRNNLYIEKKKVTIHDARPLHPTIEENGFSFTSFPTKMSYTDFNEHAKIESVYAPELQTHLKSLFQASHVRVIDYVVRYSYLHIDLSKSGIYRESQVRRRHPDFPISTGESYKDQQPAALVHLGLKNSIRYTKVKAI